MVNVITVVWSDHMPATGYEYGVGEGVLDCPQCGVRATRVIDIWAWPKEIHLGWVIDPCRCQIPDAAYEVTLVRGTVVFKAKETEESADHAEDTASTDARTDARTDDVRTPRRRVRKDQPSGRAQGHRRPAPSAGKEDEAG